ncbi:hypothetical protein SCUCBS95973_003568 [Sporothrix curviconia]|uniref:RRM domain-containing protein n=1 Tax=Sporothrix curviconia TaxID=1260050 RepID=A0ABP0BGR8_9PEZI
MADSTRWKATVFVGGLGPQVTAASLHDAFIPFGDIADVSLPKSDRNKREQTNGADEDGMAEDQSTIGHRGFAYVEFEDADDAKEAIDNMDKSDFFGRTIKVTAAKAPKAASEGLGSRTALWNQNAAAEDGPAPEPGADPMQGLEGLDVAGPRPE